MFKKLFYAAIFSLFMLAANLSHADSDFVKAFETKSVKNNYIVSLILSKNGEVGVVKQVHSLQMASNEDEALGKVVTESMRTYQGYSVINSLVSKVNMAKPNCQFI